MTGILVGTLLFTRLSLQWYVMHHRYPQLEKC